MDVVSQVKKAASSVKAAQKELNRPDWPLMHPEVFESEEQYLECKKNPEKLRQFYILKNVNRKLS